MKDVGKQNNRSRVQTHSQLVTLPKSKTIPFLYEYKSHWKNNFQPTPQDCRGNLAELVESCFSSETCIHKETELSSISVKLPIENVSVPGIYYFVFQRLSWEGINIYEVISTSNEFTILVNEEQVDKAFRIIKDLKQL